jgi:hypothetical protein
MGNASQPITQQECNKSPCQGKRTTPTLIFFYRMSKSASLHRKGALRDCHSLKFHTTNGNWAYEAGGNGGPLMTLKGEAIHIFILPTGVRAAWGRSASGRQLRFCRPHYAHPR